jgi:hypothetical protein
VKKGAKYDEILFILLHLSVSMRGVLYSPAVKHPTWSRQQFDKYFETV